MDDQKKTKEELINELQQVRAEFQKFKTLYKNTPSGFNESLYEAGACYKMLQDVQILAQIGIWEWDKATDHVTWSDELFKIAGLDASFSAPDYVQQSKIFTPQSWNVLQAAIENALSKGETYELELALTRPNGTIRNVRVIGGARFNASKNEIIGHYGLVQDETERKQLQTDLRESEVNFEMVMSTMMESFSILSVDGEFLFANDRAAYDLLVGEYGAIQGKNIRDFVSAEQADRLIEIYKQVILTKQSVTEERKLTLGACDKWFLNTLRYTLFGSEKTPAVMSVSLDITERKQAQAALQESEESFRVMADYLPQIIFESDLNGNLTFVNKNAIKAFGYPDDYPIIGKSSLDFYTPQSRLKAMENIAQKVGGEQINANNEYTMIRRDGSTFQALVYSTSIIKDGKTAGLRGIIVDITELKKAQEEIKRIGEHYQALIENASDGIVLLNDEGNFKYVSPSAKKMFGFHPSYELTGNPAELTHPDDLQMVLAEFDKIFENPAYIPTLEYRFMDAQGNWHWVETTISNLLQNPNVESLVLNFRDITERKKSELQLKKTLREQSLILENDPAFIIFKDAKNNIIRITDTVAKMTGLPKEQIEGRPSKEVYPEMADRYYVDDLEVMRSGMPKKGILETLIAVDGSVKWLLTDKIPYYDGNNEIAGILVFSTDITTLKIYEKTLIEARKQAEQSEERFRNYIQNSPTPICLVDEKGIYVFVNNATCNLLGYTQEEMLQMSVLDLMPLDGRNDEAIAFNELKRVGEIRNVEKQVVRKDGQVLDILLDGKKLSDNEYIGFVKDITERKRNAEAIRLSEEKFRKAFFTSPDSININRFADGMFISINKGFTQIVGYTKEEVQGKTLSELNIWVNNNECEIFNQELKSKGFVENVEVKFRKKDGKLGDGLISASIIELEGVPHVMSITRDITERKLAAEAIVESEEKFRTIFENSMVGKSLTYMDGSFKTNAAYCRIVGYSKEELSKLKWQAITHPDDVMDNVAVFEAILSGEKTFERWEKRYITKNGDIVWVDIITTLQRDKKGKPLYFITSILDITERKRVEKELIQAKEKAEESDRLKTAFLANMSHEIRTPMNGILGFAELLKEPDLTGDQQKRFIQIIEKSGMRMLNTINEIIDISKIEAGLMDVDIRETNINELMDYVYQFFKPEVESKGIVFAFQKSFSSDEAILETDKDKLHAIIVNLIKNALKYTSEGAIEFGYSLKINDSSCKRSVREELEFYVKDTGIGIPAQRQEAIFERFVQADVLDKHAYQGAGLGLSISKAYVKMLGGRIWVESVEGNGSTFYFTIPYNLGKQRKTLLLNGDKIGDIRDKINQGSSGLKILIVEDDEASAFLISEMVKAISSEILTATTGIEAVNQCANRADIDLVLMDIRMPEMDGYEAIQRIREFNKDVIIIAQTAHGLSGDREKSLAVGANGYISKPIKFEKLLKIIQGHFNHS